MPSYALPSAAFFKYIWMDKAKLPESIAKLIPEGTKRVRFLDNQKLRDNVFQGTLDELKPLLQDEALKSKSASLFMASDKERFVMVVPDKDENCNDHAAFKILSTDLSFKVNSKMVCQDE